MFNKQRKRNTTSRLFREYRMKRKVPFGLTACRLLLSKMWAFSEREFLIGSAGVLLIGSCFLFTLLLNFPSWNWNLTQRSPEKSPTALSDRLQNDAVIQDITYSSQTIKDSRPVQLFSRDFFGSYDQRDTEASRKRYESFRTPEVISGSYDCTSVRLRVVDAINDLNGLQLSHHSYNGNLVGPTIRVKPGTRLKIHLQNELPTEVEDDEHSSNQPHGLNTTNLHTHGLHVSPLSPADDVFKEINPNEAFDFIFDIPANHPAGTFWYHPHKHGSTAFQLASGMSGALIVDGGLDNVPQIKSANELILVLQQFMISKDTPTKASVTRSSVYEDGAGELVHSVNGVVTPTVVMRPGEIQRWRIIHAGTIDAIAINLEGILFQEIAIDGLATGRLEEKKTITLYPGYRSDVLVQAPVTEGTMLLYTVIRDDRKSIRNQVVERRDIMKVEVRGEPLPMQLPSLDDLEKVAAFRQEDVPDDNEINDSSREIEFNMGANFYHVNGNVFDEQRIDHTVSVNTAEEWKLTSRRGIHPFHIHVNAFAVKPDRPDDPWIWRDTFVVSRDAPVIIRTRFLDFDGDTVLHCHNLVHEDLGMMQRIKLQKVLPQEGIRAEGTSFRDGLAPQWRAFDQEGREWSSDQYRGKRVLLVLHRGIECLHCAEQLTRLKQDEFKLRSFGLKVITICPKLPDKPIIGGVFADYPFPILVDESRDVFRLYNCLDKAKAPMHGLFLLDSYNNIVFSTRTELAVEDPVGWVLEKLNPQSLRAKQ